MVALPTPTSARVVFLAALEDGEQPAQLDAAPDHQAACRRAPARPGTRGGIGRGSGGCRAPFSPRDVERGAPRAELSEPGPIWKAPSTPPRRAPPAPMHSTGAPPAPSPPVCAAPRAPRHIRSMRSPEPGPLARHRLPGEHSFDRGLHVGQLDAPPQPPGWRGSRTGTGDAAASPPGMAAGVRRPGWRRSALWRFRRVALKSERVVISCSAMGAGYPHRASPEAHDRSPIILLSRSPTFSGAGGHVELLFRFANVVIRCAR